MALKRVTDTQSLLLHDAAMSRRAWGFVVKLVVQTCVEQPLVQILVVVANTQTGTLRTEAEQGFI